jgi:hypothetical protein
MSVGKFGPSEKWSTREPYAFKTTNIAWQEAIVPDLAQAAHQAGPQQAAHQAGPQQAAHQAGPQQAAHQAGPQQAAHQAGPQQAAHQAGPQQEEAEPQAPGSPAIPVPNLEDIGDQEVGWSSNSSKPGNFNCTFPVVPTHEPMPWKEKWLFHTFCTFEPTTMATSWKLIPQNVWRTQLQCHMCGGSNLVETNLGPETSGPYFRLEMCRSPR